LLPPAVTFGGVLRDESSGLIVAATSARVQYQIGSSDIPQANEWEQVVLDKTHPQTGDYASSSTLRVRRMVKRSIDDEIVRLVSGDAPLFALAILAIVGWLSVTFGKANKVESRFLVAWAVLIEILFCLAFAFGMLGFLGIPVSSINAMSPFIVAGVSVDDMIVIEDFYNKAGKAGVSMDGERMGNAMKAAGVAITITSITSMVAFLR